MSSSGDLALKALGVVEVEQPNRVGKMGIFPIVSALRGPITIKTAS